MIHQSPDKGKHQLTEFQAGRQAFKRGEMPKDTWTQARREGWNFEGENQFFSATAAELEAKNTARFTAEYLPLGDAPGYSESRQPFLY